IDETRHAFLPTLMPYANNVEEVWFPGVHSDVGGGYDDNMLADAPYRFMKRRLLQSVEERGVKGLFKEEESGKRSPEYTFHFHGLSIVGAGRAKNVIGFGASMRRIRVLGTTGGERPKIHASFRSIWNSACAFAADGRNRRTWTITYDPYNVREL